MQAGKQRTQAGKNRTQAESILGTCEQKDKCRIYFINSSHLLYWYDVCPKKDILESQ